MIFAKTAQTLNQTRRKRETRYFALANGGTAVVRGRPPASLAGDRAKENTDEHQHDLAELLGQE